MGKTVLFKLTEIDENRYEYIYIYIYIVGKTVLFNIIWAIDLGEGKL